MQQYPQHTARKIVLYILPAGIVFAILGGFLIYEYKQLSQLQESVLTLRTELASTTLAFSRNTNQISKNVSDLNNKTSGLSDTLSNTQHNIDAVKNQVGGVEQTVGSISGTVGNLSGTVGNLQKLAEVDPQLLKKYSKVYFLNDNYTPAHLTSIPEEYTYSSTRPEQFLTESWSYLQNLLNSAKKENITLYVKSAYRSFAEQKTLKSTYSVTYGAGTANAFSADQGYSEHQLGTTLDFITSGLGGKLDANFEKTTSYEWLLDNAYRFGFELSYPKGNTYYVYEPWHWRYVGVKLATYLHDNKINFYDMDQREIDKYLINIFD